MTPVQEGRHYSFIGHLANALWLSYDPNRCVVIAFNGYYDASGSENDDGALIVVGLAATERKWLHFGSRWKAVLKNFSVPYFHFKELNRREGPYASDDWKNDERPALFLQTLIRELKLGVNKVFVDGVLLHDFYNINQIYRLKEGFGGAYALTAGTCIRSANNWVERKHRHAKILHVLEKGDCGQKELRKLCKREQLEPFLKAKVDKRTGEWFMPFQGADLVAGLYRPYFVAKRYNNTVRFNRPFLFEAFQQIRRMLPQQGGGHDRRTLERMCKEHPDEFPLR